MKNIIAILILFQVLQFGIAKGGFQRKIELTNVDTKFNESGTIKLYSSIRKYNRTHTSITGNCTTNDIIDKRYRFKLEVQIWGDGGWKRNYISFENNDPCQHLKIMFGRTWINVLQAAHASEECPFQKGFYQVTDLWLDISGVPLIVTTGRFKTIVDVFKEKNWVVNAEVQIIVTDIFGHT